MSPASLAARLLRRVATTSSSPFSPLARRGLNSSAPVPLPRRLPAATSSSAGTTARRFLASQSPASSSFKSSADENLRRVIESEIECVVQSEESTADKHIDLPDDFPFEIIDNPGDQTITLQREIAGETIKAAIYTNFDTEEDLDDEDDKSDKDEESFKPAIQMVVSIQKPEGPILEFDCNFNDDELAIENMRVLNRDNPAENVYDGPRFPVLDESLQKALHRYLEVRGFKHSLHDWLYEYMMRKDEKEYVVWLKNMKEFMGGN